MPGEMLRQRKKTFFHCHLTVVKQRLKEQGVIIQVLDGTPFPTLIQTLQGLANPIVAGHILLYLAPGPDIRYRPQVLQLQPSRALTSRWPARNVGLTVESQ